MSQEFIAQINLEVNGTNIDDFVSFEQKEVEVRKDVKLMHKTGYANIRKRYGFDLEYAIPYGEDEFDFDSVEDATLTVDHLDGRRESWTGVFVTKVGNTKYDGENGATRKIEFMANAKVL